MSTLLPNPLPQTQVKTRTESDSMGQIEVPANVYWGAQTQRSLLHFNIGRDIMPPELIRAFGILKKACALVNQDLGKLPADKAKLIVQAADEVIAGKLNDQFPLRVWQTGSGTQTNMNVNEVISNRAIEFAGGEMGSKKPIHPNDDVNMSQSSNDTFPTAMHIAAAERVKNALIPAIKNVRAAIAAKADEFKDVVKIGRTHLQDATPIRLGQEFSGYASQVEHGINRLWKVEEHLSELALGGTAVGTGINTHVDFARRTIEGIAGETGLKLCETPNHFEAQGGIDACVETSGALKTVAVSLIKIANDIRLLGSGPRCGLGELKLPPTQPGSSIMPGKVNPVMCEMLIQVGAQVIGNDAVVTFCGTFGNFELNVMLPVMAHNLLQSIELLTSGSRVFARRCVGGLEADVEKCEGNIEQSLAMCTSLAPVIGYDKAAEVAKIAHKTGRTIRQVALEISGLDKEKLDELLDPKSQTEPGQGSGVGGGG